MRIGAVFSQADSGIDPDAIRQWAVDAEAAGFEHLMVYDHVLGASSARLGPGPFGSFPAAPYTSQHTFHEVFDTGKSTVFALCDDHVGNTISQTLDIFQPNPDPAVLNSENAL